jgi:hypothetical protein
MFLAPFDTQFQWILSNVDATRPSQAAAVYGTQVAVDTNLYASYANIFNIADVLYDCYGILLCFNNYAASNTIRNALAQIVITNGSNIPNFSSGILINDLIVGSCSPYGLGHGGIWYYFPLFIKAGSSVAVSGRGTVATSGSTSLGVACWLFGAPKNPAAVRVGKYVDSFGVNTTVGQFRGTAITLGTTAAEGNFTQLGATTTRPYWWSQMGFAYADASQTASLMYGDLAAGTSTTVNKDLIVNQRFQITGAEQISTYPQFGPNYAREIPIGSNIYARGRVNIATADATPTMAAYLLGG